MKSAPLPDNEAERIRRLDELGILDTLEEQAYDDLTNLAATICDTPIALVSLVDRDRQWFKSHHGLDARETPRDVAFCSHAILDDNVFVVEDSGKDERFFDNPLATGAPLVKFYAGAPLVTSDNLRLGTLCVIADEPRTISEAQKSSLGALARQVVSQLELRLKVKELEGLENAKDEFISMVSHELRTPLTSISGSLSLLLNNQVGQLENEQLDMVGIAFRNANRLLCIVNDILDLAKMEAGKLQIDQNISDLLPLLEKAIELNRSYCKQCNCDLVFRSTAKGPVLVNCDENRLLQVLANLVSNAAKFSYDADTIEISLVLTDDNIRIEVVDHGPGIPEDRQEHIFQKFKQINTTENKKIPGTGLGLNICKQIIELHGGTIGFDSLPNKLTTFYFTLPLAKKPEQK